jgi:hypothetical protein
VTQTLPGKSLHECLVQAVVPRTVTHLKGVRERTAFPKDEGAPLVRSLSPRSTFASMIGRIVVITKVTGVSECSLGCGSWGCVRTGKKA